MNILLLGIFVALLIFEIFTLPKNIKNYVSKGLCNFKMLTFDIIVLSIFALLIIITNIDSPTKTDFALELILLSTLFVIFIRNTTNRITENVIYINGNNYDIETIDSFEWSDKKSKKYFSKTIEYYTLALTVKTKHKIFDTNTETIYIDIQSNDKEKINCHLTQKLNKLA
ncbi:hypothetical protein [Clostridium ihumii]|uniref:hypothetical protein n=1 Tax=Clostridium ihumii TaxID=1470356 RepID=UPI003D32E414